ncbi:hypothetical protein CWR48_05775 [Oceanobacillus arenosus]|uniref:Uncharacterized protein n=1 Tax=Oceanobacillus arenosus TaxID=1229153 RepID=A0A3D8PVM8_9BACI|nr:hypothetical protein [Oceanobacillus arenosus]RDW20210.1 hypothetical protein CWR48_05775 [Oceanobacillus arenosus]
MSRPRKKRRYSQDPDQTKRDFANRKRLRIIYGFLITMVAFVLLGVFFIVLNSTFFITNLYYAFMFNYIGTVFLYLAGMTIMLYFIYASLLTTMKNPQKVSKNQVFAWGVAGIIFLAIAVFIFREIYSLTTNSVGDMKDYLNGVTKVDEFEVVDVYTGDGKSEVALIETEERELTLLLDVFRIEEGKTYRFTYMERTGNILNVEAK